MGKRRCQTFQDPINKSAFRVQERKYKQRSRPVDLSQALDSRISDSDGLVNRGSFEFKSSKSGGYLSNDMIEIFECKRFPGLFIIPGLLTDFGQWSLAREALCCWSRRTNLDTHYDIPVSPSSNGDSQEKMGKSALFEMWQRQMSGDGDIRELMRKDVPDDHSEAQKPVAPADLISKLRWALLGVEYDWFSKVYLKPLNGLSIPSVIHQLCSDIIEPLRQILNYSSQYCPQVGIVNYYGLKDSLTAHVDRSEKTMEHPLISFNVGQSCVFLIGADDTETEPEAVLIHSGDVVIMSGEARKAFHGVPRILENRNDLRADKCTEYLDSVFEGDVAEMEMCMQFMSHSRINMNFRQIE